MSTNSPAVSKSPSMSRRLRPLSITWVSPTWRGLPGRAGTPRKPSLEPGIELLQLRLRAVLDVAVERAAVRVDPDDERAEVLDAELPQALGHELLPGDLLDLLDLGRLERRGAADDREVDHPEALHRLDRLVREAALAADRANAVLRPEAFREAHHARARRRADADLLVTSWPKLANVRRRVEEERTGQVHRRLYPLVENPDLGAVADPDDAPLDDHLVAGAELQDLGWIGDREADLVLRHQPVTRLEPPWRIAASTRVPPPWVGRPPAALTADSTLPRPAETCRFRANSSTGRRPRRIEVMASLPLATRPQDELGRRIVVMSCLPVELGRPVGGDVRRRPARRPALVVHRDGVQGHVRVRVLDVTLEDGHVSSEAHRA